MRHYKKRFHAFWMDTDSKPKGKDKRYIEKQNRQEERTRLKKLVKKISKDVL